MLYNLVVIGEAAAQISEVTRARAPEIPWTKIVGLRNLIAHEYFRIDLEVIQAIVSDQLDQLDETAERLIDEDDEPATVDVARVRFPPPSHAVRGRQRLTLRKPGRQSAAPDSSWKR